MNVGREAKSLKVFEKIQNFKYRKESRVSCYVVTTAAWWGKGACASKLHLTLDGHDEVFPVYFQCVFPSFVSLVIASFVH